MIRWYDWIVAFIAADLLLRNATTMLLTDIWWLQIITGIGAYFTWDLWNNTYIPFRKQLEKLK